MEEHLGGGCAQEALPAADNASPASRMELKLPVGKTCLAAGLAAFPPVPRSSRWQSQHRGLLHGFFFFFGGEGCCCITPAPSWGPRGAASPTAPGYNQRPGLGCSLAALLPPGALCPEHLPLFPAGDIARICHPHPQRWGWPHGAGPSLPLLPSRPNWSSFLVGKRRLQPKTDHREKGFPA